jgi:IS5 family transposase
LIAPFYPKVSDASRRTIVIARMLRMYVAQQCYGLSDKGIEDAIFDRAAMRHFVGVDPHWGAAPEASTLGKFHTLLEAHDLTRRIIETINAHLAAQGLMMRLGTIVDANLIAAPASTKKDDKQRDPEMQQSKKGND